MTIQRNYSLPNYVLLEGLSEATTGMQSPRCDLQWFGEWVLLTASKQPLSGGDFWPGDGS